MISGGDARPHPDFGTLEIRICDLPVRFTDILGITAMIQALVATLVEEKRIVPPLNQHIIKSNKWQAARYGLEGTYFDPSGMLFQQRVSLREAAIGLLERIEPMAQRLGAERYMGNIERVLADGTGADLLRCCYGTSKSLKSVVKSLWGEFWL